MDKKIFGFGLALILLSLSIMMFGCKNETIKFNRESQAGNLIEKFAPAKQKDVTKKSGGMIIIKEQKKKSFDRCGKEDAQADYEREEYKNDVRYQDRTEITLDYEWQNVIKGYFYVWDIWTAKSRIGSSVFRISFVMSANPWSLGWILSTVQA